MTIGGKRIVSVWGVIFWVSAVMVSAEAPVDDAPSTHDRQIEDMKKAFEEITESFRQRVADLERNGASERDAAAVERDAALADRDAALAERDAALAERDAALAKRDTALAERDAALADRDASVVDRDALIVERDTARERSEALEEERQALEKQVETLTAELRAGQDSIHAATAVQDAEIERLRDALAKAQAANTRERFALAYNLGNIYKAAREYARAEEEFLKALDMNANDSALHYNMGILYDDNLGDREKARYHYERFLALAPNDPDAPNVVKWLNELDL